MSQTPVHQNMRNENGNYREIQAAEKQGLKYMQKITLKFFKKESMKLVRKSAENICTMEPSGK